MSYYILRRRAVTVPDDGPPEIPEYVVGAPGGAINFSTRTVPSAEELRLDIRQLMSQRPIGPDLREEISILLRGTKGLEKQLRDELEGLS